jgi:hypothetical protein
MRPQGDEGRAQAVRATLSERLQGAMLADKAPRRPSADYARITRASVPEEVEQAAEDASRRVQTKNSPRRPKRSFDRGRW